MRRIPLPATVILGCVLVAGAGCNRGAGAVGQAPDGSPASTTPGASGAPGPAGASAAATKTQSQTTRTPPPPPAWPTPEDCISYNPANVTVHYEAGTYAVNDGTKNVMRLPGGPGENVGQKGLALAQRFRKHCFLGRTNTREDKNSYAFDYWRDPSGMTPAIADQDEDCSGYNRTNLTVEDMGSGHGWRVKDHDHVLHLFDSESDARNGKLVLAKYSRICFLGNSGDDDPALVSYSL